MSRNNHLESVGLYLGIALLLEIVGCTGNGPEQLPEPKSGAEQFTPALTLNILPCGVPGFSPEADRIEARPSIAFQHDSVGALEKWTAVFRVRNPSKKNQTATRFGLRPAVLFREWNGEHYVEYGDPMLVTSPGKVRFPAGGEYLFRVDIPKDETVFQVGIRVDHGGSYRELWSEKFLSSYWIGDAVVQNSPRPSLRFLGVSNGEIEPEGKSKLMGSRLALKGWLAKFQIKNSTQKYLRFILEDGRPYRFLTRGWLNGKLWERGDMMTCGNDENDELFSMAPGQEFQFEILIEKSKSIFQIGMWISLHGKEDLEKVMSFGEEIEVDRSAEDYPIWSQEFCWPNPE